MSECPFPAATANIWDTYRTGNHMIIGPCETVTADMPPPWYLIIIQILNTLAASAQVPFILPNDVIFLNPRLLSTVYTLRHRARVSTSTPYRFKPLLSYSSPAPSCRSSINRLPHFSCVSVNYIDTNGPARTRRAVLIGINSQARNSVKCGYLLRFLTSSFGSAS